MFVQFTGEIPWCNLILISAYKEMLLANYQKILLHFRPMFHAEIIFFKGDMCGDVRENGRHKRHRMREKKDKRKKEKETGRERKKGEERERERKREKKIERER